MVIVRDATTDLLSCPVCSHTHASARNIQRHCKTHVASHLDVDLPPVIDPNVVVVPIADASCSTSVASHPRAVSPSMVEANVVTSVAQENVSSFVCIGV
jgi:hypothetical protein